MIPTREVQELEADLANGHNARKRANAYVNELLALIQGGISRLGAGPWTLADIGSRDIKVVRVEHGRPVAMDWNNSCGALTGFTLELLGRYFCLDFSAVSPVPEGLAVTCGVLGMERLFDEVASGRPVEQAIAAFVRGMASFTHAFINRPDRFYLSGGMCDNPLFLNSFPKGTEVVPLGRFVLVDGLLHEAEKA